MRTIVEPRKNVMLLWRQAKPIQAKYRLMKYLLEVQVEDGTLLYNVVTSELVLLDNDETEIVRNLPSDYRPAMDHLIADHFIVKEDFDECKLVLQLRAVLRKLDAPERITGFTILPTTECNARCFYCFESDHKHCTMTADLASDVVKYITDMCKSKRISLGWFGGEPLVAHKRISQICAALHEKGIEIRSSMVSNGYLFDHDLVQKAKSEWNLGSVQITLDGTEDVYNKTKAYINPRDNPFQKVLGNIDELLDNGIIVSVRLNVTDKNAEDLSKLVDELAARFAGKRGFTCYAHAVYENVGFEPLSYDNDIKEQVNSQTVMLERKLGELGLLGKSGRLPYLRIRNCMADNDSCRLIYPDGTIGKCENMSSSMCMGDIYKDITDPDMNEQYNTSVILDGCKDCFLYPHCVNLKLCPETGRCSKAKVEWKRQRFSDLMKSNYKSLEAIEIETQTEPSNLAECES